MDFIYIKLYHEVVHAIQLYNGIKAKDNNLGNSNLEYESYVIGEFLRKMYSPINNSTAEDDKVALEFCENLRHYIMGEVEGYDDKQGLNIKDFASTCLFYYPKFLHFYGKDGESYIPAYSDHNDSSWTWNWELYMNNIGIKIKQ